MKVPFKSAQGIAPVAISHSTIPVINKQMTRGLLERGSNKYNRKDNSKKDYRYRMNIHPPFRCTAARLGPALNEQISHP
jgi:hypothetical protein